MLTLGVVLCAYQPRAEAQSDTPPFEGPVGEASREGLSQARDLFVQGTNDAEAGRWADALHAFAEAYRLSGIAAALYNAATTLRSIGRYRHARDAFDQLLESHPDLADEMRESARSLRREVARRVAILTVDDLPEDPELRLRLDGTPRPDTGARPLDLETDGGQHSLRVEREGFEPFLWEGRINDGDRVRVPAVFVELPELEGSNVGRIIIFIAVGLALVAGGVTLGLLLREEGLSPNSMNVVEL